MIILIVEFGFRSFMMSFRMSLMVELAPQKLTIMLDQCTMYIDFGEKKHFKKGVKINLGGGGGRQFGQCPKERLFFF